MEFPNIKDISIDKQVNRNRKKNIDKIKKFEEFFHKKIHCIPSYFWMTNHTLFINDEINNFLS